MNYRLELLLVVMLLVGFSTVGFAKCGALLITIEGEVRGKAKPEQGVTVDVQPDSYWSFQLAGNSPAHFVIQVPFSTFSGRSTFGSDRCERTPRTIAVMLQDWLQTVDGVELKYPEDFAVDQEGSSHARDKVILDVNHVGPPWIRKSGRGSSKLAPKRLQRQEGCAAAGWRRAQLCGTRERTRTITGANGAPESQTSQNDVSATRAPREAPQDWTASPAARSSDGAGARGRATP
jgi:hypothetical protein